MSKKKNRKNTHGRYTPPGTRTARNTTYQLRQKPSAEERAFIHEVFQSGWARWFPVQIFEIVGAAWENSFEDGPDAFEDVRMDAPLWESRHKDDEEYFAEHIPLVQRFADKAGVPLPQTTGELVPVLAHFGVLQTNDAGVYVSKLPLPLVTETGVLTTVEVAEEDRLRWAEEFEPHLQQVINIFMEDNRDEWKTTIAEMAETLEIPEESARATAELLADEPDFSVEPAPKTIDLRDPITITVDWEAFDENRISIS